jgi:iron complex outermembrane receptor protein
MIHTNNKYAGACLIFTLFGYVAIAHATTPSTELVDLSLQELANIEITTVSKRAEPLANAAASVFVITNDDIRRSGATSLPEALRLAPNLQVARDNARNYAISARGGISVFANKMLVLIDGRSVYTPLYAGIFWDAQDVVLEDIERIEVISGANTTVWGTNAVNGVINVITRNAAATQGGLAVAGGSNHEKNGVLRYGGELPNGGHYRAYGKHVDVDDSQFNGRSVQDGFRRNQAGFRADWSDADGGVTLQGDAYEGSLHQLGTRDIYINGANLMSRFSKHLAEHSDVSLQAYIDHTTRDQPGAYRDNLTTVDIELKHAKEIAHIHNVVWGLGYRASFDRIDNNISFAFLPESKNLFRTNAFAQDEIALMPDLRLTLGFRLSNNNYSGTESLPNVRLAWNVTPNQLLWGSASRAIRTPSRIDRDFFAPGNAPVVGGVPLYLIAGGEDFSSEIAKTYEIGYRAQPTAALSYSLTAFYTDYDELRTLEPNANGFGFVFDNQARGRTHGIEMWGKWQVREDWQLSAGLVVQDNEVTLEPGSRDISRLLGLGDNDPNHYWQLRSSYDITPRHELDVILRGSGELPQPQVDAYTTMDIRFGWKINRDLELALVGQNLIGHEHTEFNSQLDENLFDRRLFANLTWRFQ